MNGYVQPVVEQVTRQGYTLPTSPFDGESVDMKEVVSAADFAKLFRIAAPALMDLLDFLGEQVKDAPQGFQFRPADLLKEDGLINIFFQLISSDPFNLFVEDLYELKLVRDTRTEVSAYPLVVIQDVGFVQAYLGRSEHSHLPLGLLDDDPGFLSSLRQAYPIGYVALRSCVWGACTHGFSHVDVSACRLDQVGSNQLLEMLSLYPIRLRLESAYRIRFRLNLPTHFSIRHVGLNGGGGQEKLPSWEFALTRTCFLLCYALS